MSNLLESTGEAAGSSIPMNITSENRTETLQTPIDHGLHNPILYVNTNNKRFVIFERS